MTSTQQFNALIEEFDRKTRFQFDTESDVATIAAIAACWPSCRRMLASDITKAASVLPPIDAPATVCDSDSVKTTESYLCPACGHELRHEDCADGVILFCGLGRCPVNKMNDGAKAATAKEAHAKLEEILLNEWNGERIPEATKLFYFDNKRQ